MPDRVYINGRFLSAGVTGVQRTATELVKALDGVLSDAAAGGRPLPEVILLHPRAAKADLKLASIRLRPAGRLSGQAWEQLELPRHAADGVLVNLCNVGPLFKRRSLTMIHDMQTRTQPASYSLPFRAWYRVAHTVIGRMHDTVLTVSDFSRQEIARFGVAPAERIVCVPNGCDHLAPVAEPGAAARFGLVPGRFVLSLASTQAHKNLAVLLKAFADARLGDVPLALFGSAARQAVEAGGVPVPSNVVFLGRVSDADLAGLISEAGCMACPSLTEGFGLMPLEAMRLGCPVVAAPCGALPETSGDAALYAAPHAPGEWVERIREVLDDPETSRELVARGHVRAGLYTWENAARKLLHVILQEPVIAGEKVLPQYEQKSLRA